MRDSFAGRDGKDDDETTEHGAYAFLTDLLAGDPPHVLDVAKDLAAALKYPQRTIGETTA